MSLTPADVRNKQFSATGLARRGYNDAEVDEFLDEVTHALEERDAVIEALRDTSGTTKVSDAEPVPAATPSAGQAVAVFAEPATPTGSDAAAQVLAMAQLTADEVLGAANATAARLVAQASQEVESTLSAAREEAQRLVNTAQQRQAALAEEIENDRRELETIRQAVQSTGEEARRGMESYLHDVLARIRDLTPAEQPAQLRIMRAQ